MRTRSRGIERSAWLHLLAAGANIQKAIAKAAIAKEAISIFFLVAGDDVPDGGGGQENLRRQDPVPSVCPGKELLGEDGLQAVGELEELVGLSQSALSQHLARLRRDGMVKTRRDAQKIYYSLSDPRVSHLLTCLASMHGVGTDAEDVVAGGDSVTVLRTA